MNKRPGKSHNACQRRGVTLLELVISTSITSMLFVGMASAISLASNSVPGPNSLSATTVSTQRVLEQMAGEVLYAMTVTKATSTTLEFTVADRDGQAPTPEKIKYSWAGAGTPLTRQYNNGSGIAVIDKVQSLQFTTDTMADSTGTVIVTVRCAVQTTSDTRTRLATTFRLLNRPAPPAP